MRERYGRRITMEEEVWEYEEPEHKCSCEKPKTYCEVCIDDIITIRFQRERNNEHNHTY